MQETHSRKRPNGKFALDLKELSLQQRRTDLRKRRIR
jgi:hypothetical protein